MTASAHDANTLEAAALFGLSLPLEPLPRETPEVHQPDPGHILLITGPSGAGKTTALRSLTAGSSDRIINLDAVRLRNRPVVEQFARASATQAMRAAAAAGLADARAFLKTPAQLSAGQRWRLTLAVALHRAARSAEPTLLIADEFAALLDHPTATAVARLLRKAISREPKIAAAIATTRDDLTSHLAPDRILTCSLSAPPRESRHSNRPRPLPLRFALGDESHYDALAPHHYLAGKPATIERVLAAFAPGDHLAAVLVVSRPTLNSPHRDLAWPRRYTGSDKAAAARRVNRELRTLSRVIVDPRCQGLGVARRLVARYLADPITPCTEAVAAMGAVSPFFARAGMTAYTLPPSKRNARFIDALHRADLAQRDLADPAASLARAARSGDIPFLERELRLWAASSGATGRRADDPIECLWRLAATRLTPTIAYAHTKH